MASLSNDPRRRLVVLAALHHAAKGWNFLDRTKVLFEPSISNLFKASIDKSRSMMCSPKAKCESKS